MPTLPEESILSLSVPPVVVETVSAAGKKTPVLVSPALKIDGALAEPSGNPETPVMLGFELLVLK